MAGLTARPIATRLYGGVEVLPKVTWVALTSIGTGLGVYQVTNQPK